MEVMVPTVNDFHFDSTASSPYVSASSSPKRFGDPFDYYNHYTSAPTSPSRVAAIFASSSVPFGWEEMPGTTPRSAQSDVGCGVADLDDFAFDFRGQLEKGVPPQDLTAADELFEKGKIKPLKPPPRLYSLSLDHEKAAGVASTTPRSPRSPRVTAATVEASTGERGRERGLSPSSHISSSVSSSQSRKGSRSLSPMRKAASYSAATIATECLKTTGSGGSSRKWRLRDLLLFRSASEGRVTGNKSKDPLRKYTITSSSNSSSSLLLPSPKRKGGEDSRSSSFKSTDSGGSIRKSTDTVHGSMRRGSGQTVSAHKMPYVSSRAAAEEMKKTALPFNPHGLFGCLRFSPAAHSIARGFHNSYSFGRRQS